MLVDDASEVDAVGGCYLDWLTWDCVQELGGLARLRGTLRLYADFRPLGLDDDLFHVAIAAISGTPARPIA